MTPDIDNIIAKVLSKEATDSEVHIFEKWLKEDKNNYKSFYKVKTYWNRCAKTSINVDEIHPNYNLFAERLNLEKSINKNSKRKSLYIITAVSSIAACLVVLLYTMGGNHKDSPIVFHEFSTSAQIDTITLPDNSRVILNKNSNLQYSNLFNKEDRTVILKGEALFDVNKNEALPFVVQTDTEDKIVVLGTVFSVNSYTKQDCINVTLFSGSVRFQTQQNEIFMVPNQELTFDKKNKKIDLRESDTALALLWLHGIYRYKSITLKKLTNVLSKVYSVDISINSTQLANTNISGAFYNDQSLDEILEIVSRSLPMQWTKNNNNNITISSNL